MKIKMIILVIVLAGFGPVVCGSEDVSNERYLQPRQDIKKIVLSPWWNNISLKNLSPDGRRFVIGQSDSMPQISHMAKPFYNLAEVEIDYQANRHRDFSINLSLPEKAGKVSVCSKYYLFDIKSKEKTLVQTPAGATVSNAVFSPDGKEIAYFAHFDDGSYIYTADTSTGNSRKVCQTPCLAVHVKDFEWTADSKKILAVLVPQDRGDEPTRNEVPNSPKVRLTNDGLNPTRTHKNLLQDEYDKDLLEYYCRGQLALIDVNSGDIKKIGDPEMFLEADVSPDGEYMRVKILQKPFSYIVPLKMFGSVEQLWDIQGKVLAELIKTPLNLVEEGAKNTFVDYEDGAKPKKNEKAKRYLRWSPDGQGLVFLKQKKKGNDQLCRWAEPFEPNDFKVLYEQKDKLDDEVTFSEDMAWVFLSETKNKVKHVFAVKLSEPDKKYSITKAKSDEFYDDPGKLITKPNNWSGSTAVVSSDGKHVFLKGVKYFKDIHKDGPRPFVDKVAIEDSSNKERVFESPSDKFEQVTVLLDDDLNRFVTECESTCEIANSFLHDRKAALRQKLTDNKDYCPKITSCQRKRVLVENLDGHKFWVTVTLPLNFDGKSKPPAMIWFYPRDYTSQKEFDEKVTRTFNKNEFQSISNSNSSTNGTRSMMILTKLGYSYVRPDFPYFGNGNKAYANDYYVSELRNNLWAIIETLDKLGYVDRDRMAIGGHSYGAFSTANALIHTPFFKAGIAGDGNYNRTLTPSGWQNERRHLWSARQTHVEVSAMLQAEKLNGALLMYHGGDDENVGCSPIYSEKLFAVLNTLGKKAAYYEYPYEHHSPITEQTVLDMWARWVPWLQKHIKN